MLNYTFYTTCIDSKQISIYKRSNLTKEVHDKIKFRKEVRVMKKKICLLLLVILMVGSFVFADCEPCLEYLYKTTVEDGCEFYQCYYHPSCIIEHSWGTHYYECPVCYDVVWYNYDIEVHSNPFN